MNIELLLIHCKQDDIKIRNISRNKKNCILDFSVSTSGSLFRAELENNTKNDFKISFEILKLFSVLGSSNNCYKIFLLLAPAIRKINSTS